MRLLKYPPVFGLARPLAVLTVVCTTVLLSAADCFASSALLVIRQNDKNFEETMSGLTQELGDDYTVSQYVYSDKPTLGDLTSCMDTVKPALIVAMDNRSIALVAEYESKQPTDTPKLPVIALMGIDIANAIKPLGNASGITYEIPLVTSIVNLRAILKQPLRRVGVIHRPLMNQLIEQNRTFCARESIDVVAAPLEAGKSDYSADIKKTLKQLATKDSVKAIWVPNDNALLSPTIIQEVWLPFVKKYKLPIIVGVEVLVNPALNFGTFAVLPDHTALGSQAAEMVIEVMEDYEGNASEVGVQPPLSVFKIINFKQARDYFDVQKEQLNSVDKVKE